MQKKWRPFASYNLWSLFASPIGKEHLYCPMKRGYTKACNKEPEVAALLLQDTAPQRIGLLVQQGIYSFHSSLNLLTEEEGLEQVASLLQLSQESAEVREQVIGILKNYQSDPILMGKTIIQLNRGDEGFPKPILIQHGEYEFNLFAAIDCIFAESDGTFHILDFKTGKSSFDQRQAFVYLLAAQYLYPRLQFIASFYNVEFKQWSTPIAATRNQLQAIQAELAQISQQHQEDLRRYKQNPADFAAIFPPNPGKHCHYCLFNSICQFATPENVG